jgi:hypothetical protein
VRYEFNIDEWLPRFPLPNPPQYGYYQAAGIASPGNLCINEQLRDCLSDQYDWGPAEPVDIFVMAEGEPSERHVTKIGGVPYRPAGLAWPTGLDGKNAVFLAQFCFADSHDIVGDLPGKVLLVFGLLPPEGYQYCEEVLFEWYPLELKELIRPSDVPSQPWKFEPCFGYRYRGKSFPRGKRIGDVNEYPRCNGFKVCSRRLLLQYEATQIGRAPFFIQQEAQNLPGRPLCTIGCPQPAADVPYPFVNDPTPIPLMSYPHDKWLMMGDTGCLYISIDDDGALHWCEECY